VCGIAGIVNTEAGPLAGDLAAMTRLASHRGPDDEGMVLFAADRFEVVPPAGAREAGWNAGLGHRRLSIIDLSPGGHQPMGDPTGRFWIVLNGEIYNYLELRAELAAAGCAFRSRSDTEVVLAAFILWGESCLERMNGMWAFAVYDRERARLFCARDRFGVKPFYYQASPGRFRFASEVKQLLSGGPERPVADPAAFADFALWGFQDHEEGTFVRGIRALPGGHCLRMGREEVALSRVEPHRYWKPSPEGALDLTQSAHRFRELLTDSVRLRLRSDVPVGITLSGGLDSSSVTCLAAELRHGEGASPPQAFSAIFPDPKYSEEDFARAVADRAGVDRVLIEPGAPQLARDWPSFVRAMDEPFQTLSFYANWKVYQKIREHGVPVILNGQGGDELLLGYERYRVPLFLHLLKGGRIPTLLSELWRGRTRANMGLTKQLAYTVYFLLPRIRAGRRLRLVRPYLKREILEYGRRHRQILAEASIARPWPDFLVREFERYQLQHLLHHEDRVSMHFSVEARNPFLDYRLFNFVIGQDIRTHLRDGWSKALLREAMRGVLPESVRARTDKMGFDTPTGRLLRENETFFLGLLSRHEDDPFVDVAALRRGLSQGGAEENVLCSLLSYLSWKETFDVAG